MKHTEFVKLLSKSVEQLQAEKGDNISEDDIREKAISIYNSKSHRKYLLKKECGDRIDMVIYNKQQGEGCIHSIYELKTYFKNFEEIEMAAIRQDFVKLHKKKQSNNNVKAYFIMISTYNHLEYYSKHKKNKDFIDPLYKKKDNASLNTRGKDISFVPRKEYARDKFRISIWEIL